MTAPDSAALGPGERWMAFATVGVVPIFVNAGAAMVPTLVASFTSACPPQIVSSAFTSSSFADVATTTVRRLSKSHSMNAAAPGVGVRVGR